MRAAASDVDTLPTLSRLPNAPDLVPPLQLRASRVAARWAAKITLSFYTITIIRCTAFVLIAAHWFACTFALQAALHDEPYRTWLGTYGYCTQLDADEIADLDLLSEYATSSSIWNLEYARPL